jgi:pimeloyl-ACP methyl ester carboxylesterase
MFYHLMGACNLIQRDNLCDVESLPPSLKRLVDVASRFDLCFRWHIVAADEEESGVRSYDRFGLGWSEPSSGARDAVSIAAQLHTLLNVAKISGPLLLVGHSRGGLYIRAFRVIHPENVVGMVFVDATSTKLYQAIPEAAETPSQRRDRHLEAQ